MVTTSFSNHGTYPNQIAFLGPEEWNSGGGGWVISSGGTYIAGTNYPGLTPGAWSVTYDPTATETQITTDPNFYFSCSVSGPAAVGGGTNYSFIAWLYDHSAFYPAAPPSSLSSSSNSSGSAALSSSGVSSSNVSSLSSASSSNTLSSSSAPSSSSQGSLSSISSQSLTSLTSISSGVSASSSLSSALSGSSGSTPSSSFSRSATSLISTGSGVSASSSGTTGGCIPVNNYYVNLRGWEVGQRTNEFLSDYAHTETSTLVWRDELATTEVRTRQQLIHYDYGDAGIPSWLKGAKSFDVLNGLVPYLDRSILRALTDLFRARVFSLPIEQAMSCFGPGSDLETGKQNIRFRKAFFMSAALSTTDPSGFTYSPGDAVTSGLFSTSGTVTIREAASYWDFSTAFDPVYLALDTEEGYLFRNLDPVTQFIPSTTTPVSTIITDDPVAFVWSGSPSLSDSTYMPPAMAERLEAPGLDLSGGVLSAGGSPSASFLSPGLSLTYPVSQFTTS